MARDEQFNPARRHFIQAGAALGGGLLIGFSTRATESGAAAVPTAFAPNAFIRIGADGTVTLTMAYVEMGQGTYTSIPMLIAEELEVELDTVRLEHAGVDQRYVNPILKVQATGGSTTMRAAWLPMRQAGAVARTMLVAAAARRWQVAPSACLAARGQVMHAASGRRLGYGELAPDAALLPLPAPGSVALKQAKNFRLIGTPARRLDAADKVNGKALFGIDVRLPGMKVAALAAAPVFGGKLRKVDQRAAMQVKGVLQVVRLDDMVAVVAQHYGAARKGLAALVLEWDDGALATLSTADIVKTLETASLAPGAVARSEGDALGTLAGAAPGSRREEIYQVPFLAHATMEPVNCTVHCERDRCTLWTGTQVPGRARDVAAEVSRLAPERVTVHNHLLGGGFGRRLEVDMVRRAVRIAMQVDGPVKVIWSREEDMRQAMYRPYFYNRIAAALGPDGLPLAWHHRTAGSSVLSRWAPAAVNGAVDHDAVEGAAHPPYGFASMLVDYVRVEPPGIGTAFWRGVGATRNLFVVESFIDELAADARRDPVAYRMALLANNPRAAAVLTLAAQRAQWDTPLPKGVGRGVSLQFAFGSYMAQVAEVEVTADGGVILRRVVCAVDCGIVVNPDTVRAQVESGVIFGAGAALYGAITMTAGRIDQSNFHDYRVLRMNEAPRIETHIVASDEAPGGMGEPGTAGIAPAIANAMFAVTGKRIRTLPLVT